MKIEAVRAREIYDSRGMPTVECDIMLSSGEVVRASVPAGKSKGSMEPVEKRDAERLMGFGVQSAVDTILHTIAPLISGQEPDVVVLDELLLAADGTANKSHLGANAMLAVSTAICKAQALAEGMEVYECIAYLCDIDTVSIPCPMFNIFEGGLHARNGFPIQEVMIMPVGIETFKEALEIGSTVFHQVHCMLEKKGLSTLVGDEGGFAPDIDQINPILNLISEALHVLSLEDKVVFGLDMAASFWYNAQTQEYSLYGAQRSSYALIEWYEELIGQYPIYAIEDGLAEYDWLGWQHMTKLLGEKVQLVGDDIFVTNVQRIATGIEQEVGNAVLIKPTQAGTITETLQAVKLCQEYEMPVIVSHRSGETNDCFIADLAIGCNALQIKAGGCTRGERVAKYNRLLEIEEQLYSNR